MNKQTLFTFRVIGCIMSFGILCQSIYTYNTSAIIGWGLLFLTELEIIIDN